MGPPSGTARRARQTEKELEELKRKILELQKEIRRRLKELKMSQGWDEVRLLTLQGNTLMPEQAPEHIRSFIAIPIPPEIIGRVADAQRRIRETENAELVRWTRPEQLHITLKFLGNISCERLSALEGALRVAASGVAPFPLSLENLGSFPSSRSPNVFWIGLGGRLEALKELQSRIAVQTAGFAHREENRQFHPHVTIGRTKGPGAKARRIGEALSKFHLADTRPWMVEEITLTRSKLGSGGAIHSPIAAVRLIG